MTELEFLVLPGQEVRNQKAPQAVGPLSKEISMHSIFYTIGVIVVVLFAITLIA